MHILYFVGRSVGKPQATKAASMRSRKQHLIAWSTSFTTDLGNSPCLSSSLLSLSLPSPHFCHLLVLGDVLSVLCLGEYSLSKNGCSNASRAVIRFSGRYSSKRSSKSKNCSCDSSLLVAYFYKIKQNKKLIRMPRNDHENTKKWQWMFQRIYICEKCENELLPVMVYSYLEHIFHRCSSHPSRVFLYRNT